MAIQLAGLYLFYVQVTFTEKEGTVHLFVGQTSHTELKIISKAEKPSGNSDSCVTVAGVHRFRVGDKVNLNVTTPFKHDADKTYWGLFLLSEI